MNKRARNRLIGVTAIILIAVAAIIYGTQTGPGGGSYSRKVSEVVKDQANLSGKRVQVNGPVVAGSWNKKTNPMVFAIADEGAAADAATIKVSYNGGVPTTFGDGTVAIVTGTLEKDGTIKADTLLTKCPSKYAEAKAADAPGVKAVLTDKAKYVGKPTEVQGYVAKGSIKDATAEVRFMLAESADGAASSVLPVIWGGAMSAEIVDGTHLLVTGKLGADGKYTATGVSVIKKTAAQ